MESIKTYNSLLQRWEWKNSQSQYHREGGPAQIYDNGSKCWYKDGFLHRENGPAIEYSDGHNRWFLNGVLHRIDGPAIEYLSGYKEWYYHGKYINCQSQEKFERLIKLQAFL